MTALAPAVSAAQTGHPITCAVTLPTSNPNTLLLICAGGSAVSVQAAPRWWASATHSDAANGSNNGVIGTKAATAAAGSGSVFAQLRHSSVDLQTVSGLEAGKGADVLIAAVQQWSASRHSSASQDDIPVFSSSSNFTTTGLPVLPAEQRSNLRAGEITCLCVAALPGTNTAVAVVGTTVGTVALFLIEGSRTLCKVAERSLVQWSRGSMTAQDAVVDVAFSMDPAGRPEFVSAASAGCVVVVDVQLLYRSDNEDDEDPEKENEVNDESVSKPTNTLEGVHVTQRTPLQTKERDNAWSTSVLRAKAIEALERPHAQLVRRSRSDVFTCAFAEANVVRVLAPQRLQAAVALDVALVIVLNNGTLHYVERVVEGGSVRLLAEHHRLRLAKGSAFITYAQDSMLEAPTAIIPSQSYGNGDESIVFDGDSRALPHVIYRYRLSPCCVNVCQACGTSHSSNSTAAAAAAGSSSDSNGDAVTTVNDAALYFSEKDAVCNIVLAGTQLVPTHKVSARTSFSPNGDTGTTGWTLGRLLQERHNSNSVGAHRAMGWWAVVRNAVLPRFTFDRAALERQAFQQASRTRGSMSAAAPSTQFSSLQFNQTNASNRDDFAAAYCTDSGSPFMVHVQSNVMALPAAPLCASALRSINTGRQIAATAAAAASRAGAFEGSGSYLPLPTPPTVSSPTGTGAHAAASNTAAGLGNGFASAAMMNGVLVLSSGTDVYVGDLSEVPVSAKALPMLRPVRSFGSVVESVSFEPYREARSVLVASGSCVMPVLL